MSVTLAKDTAARRAAAEPGVPEPAAVRLILERAFKRSGHDLNETCEQRELLSALAEIGIYGEQGVRLMDVAEAERLIGYSQAGGRIYVSLTPRG